MTHDHATGAASPACPACKKVINNFYFIAPLAPLIEGPEAAKLAGVASAYANIQTALGNVPEIDDDFEGCEQGQLLVKWIGGEPSDPEQMKEWTAAILSAIGELAAGKTPK